MARLFSAFVPPSAVLDHLAGWIDGLAAPVRWTPRERWHVTVGFFGDDDDPDRRSKWLLRRVAGRSAPALRLAGAGSYRGVLWVGLEADDEQLLARLAQAGGAGRRGYQPHLTVARWRTAGADISASIALFDAYTGPWFTPAELLLMRSELGKGGPTYTKVRSVALARSFFAGRVPPTRA